MNYYLFRQAPNEENSVTHEMAKRWNVVMILKSRSFKIAPDTLYKSTNTGTVYVHEAEEYEYDLMDAFDMPHATRKHFSLVVPQILFSPMYHTTIKYDGKFILFNSTRRTGPFKGQRVGIHLHARMG